MSAEKPENTARTPASPDAHDTTAQQHTGNHKPEGAPDEQGADRFGGTRAGKENVEKQDR